MKGGVEMKFQYQQKGNVLFLILIAVALFAALSYAVTKSSRSGGDASRETNILNAAQLTQYPTSVRTAVMRLIIDGFQDTNILYSEPGDNETSSAFEVFHAVGGGAVFQRAPEEMMQLGGINEAGTWFINMSFEIPELGRDNVTGLQGNELIAFLPGITESVCSRINMEANIIQNPSVDNPVVTAPASALDGSVDAIDYNITLATDYDNAGDEILDSTANDLVGQSFGCFEYLTGSGDYVMYQVLLER